jgi:hypothetical protein
MSPVPNHARIVTDVAAAHPELLTRNTHPSCAEFLQRVIAALPPNEPWGYVAKSPGENGFTFANGVRVAIDVIAWRDPYTQIDVLANSGANDDSDPNTSGPARPDWRPIDPSVYRPGNVWVDPATVPPLTEPGPNPGQVCLLGASWFWLMAGLKFWPDQVKQNLDWLAANMPIDYARVLAVVGGDTFVAPDGSRADPWEQAGAWLSWPDHGALIERVTDLLFDYGIKTEWTLIGGLGQIPRDVDQDRMVDHVVAHLRGREHKLQLVEIMNEYHVNGGGNITRLHRLARRVRSGGLSSVDLSLSSPNCGESAERIAAEVEALYRNFPEANAITPHWDRQDHVAPPLGSWAPSRRYSNEPRGPGASAGGNVTDPATLARDYQSAIGAGYVGYVFHSDWGIWDRHLHPAFVSDIKGVTANVWEIENMQGIAPALSEVRRTMGDGPTPPRPPRSRDALTSGESLRGDEALVSPNGRYQLLYQLDGNLVIYGSEGPTWWSATDGESVGSLDMQGDGNLVLYDEQGRPLRATRTDGNPGAMVQLQDDGNLVVYADPHGPNAGTPLRAVTNGFYRVSGAGAGLA